MVINRNFGWPNLNLGGALTKSGGTSVHIVRLSKREIVGSLTYLPFFLSRIRLTISVPVFFISDAVHCILHANTCNLSRKYLRPSLQVLATAPASTCGKRRHYIGISSPMFFYWPNIFSGHQYFDITIPPEEPCMRSFWGNLSVYNQAGRISLSVSCTLIFFRMLTVCW